MPDPKLPTLGATPRLGATVPPSLAREAFEPQAATSLRVFYANRKSDEGWRDEAERALKVLRARFEGPPFYRYVSLVGGADDWDANFRRCGGWDGWYRDVAQGWEYGGRGPRYHAFVVPDTSTGRPTRVLLTLALGQGKDVWFWNRETATLHRVERVDIDPTNGNKAIVAVGAAL